MFVGKLMKNCHLEDLEEDGRTTLSCNINKYECTCLKGFVFLFRVIFLNENNMKTRIVLIFLQHNINS
jgi:hypothetical protein